jgi:hypothetical protein
MSLDDVLGQQQDHLASQRYELVKLLGKDPPFQGCRTPLDVYSRLLELQGEEGLRAVLIKLVQEQYPRLADSEQWMNQMVAVVRRKDDGGLKALFQRAVLSNLVPPG